jgi:hypothetical protein
MRLIIFFATLISVTSLLLAETPKLEVNLRGKWRFEIGDHPEYAQPGLEDSHWEKIRVPDAWEKQGFPGYDGYAWYRTSFDLSDKLKNRVIMLNLGYIDDVDQVFINGHFIGGRGSTEPNYISAYDHLRYYQIPNVFLHFNGKNTLAVRVYDEWGAGGIVSGRIGIYSQKSPNTTIDITGNWKFINQDGSEFADPGLDDKNWSTVVVPGIWENQGFPDQDGYGWYRKTVFLPDALKRETLILFIGAIDDADEVYFNGEKVGSTGRFPGEEYRDYNQRFYNRERFYYIPGDIPRWGTENTIAIRVYDSGGEGGIHRGPVGITTRKAYKKFRELYKKREPSLSDFITELLGN